MEPDSTQCYTIYRWEGMAISHGNFQLDIRKIFQSKWVGAGRGCLTSLRNLYPQGHSNLTLQGLAQSDLNLKSVPLWAGKQSR